MHPPSRVLLFKRLRRLGFLAAFAWILAPTIAGADYVRYFKVSGGWAVTCWWDRVTNRENCSLESPPPSAGPERSGSVMRIMQTKPDAFDITIEIRGIADPGSPVRLEIDGKPLSPAGLDPAYRARWQGAQAKSIIGLLQSAQQAMLIWRDRNGAENKEKIILNGFPEALADFQSNLRRRGVLQEP